jgi:hypothetical protein
MIIDQVEQTDTTLMVTVISTRTEAHCPRCGYASEQVHSLSINEPFMTFPEEVVRCCFVFLFASFSAATNTASAKYSPNGLPIWFNRGEEAAIVSLHRSQPLDFRLLPRSASA